MWFDELMDDCKQALALVWSNRWIALPYILHSLVVGLIAGGLLAVTFFMFIVGAVGTVGSSTFPIWSIIAPLLIGVTLAVLVFSVLSALVDAGSISMFAWVAEGYKPDTRMFWEGVRKYFLSMWGIQLFLGALALVLSPILALLALLFVVTIGILSGGWGLLIIPVLGLVFFSAWPMALILDGQGGFKALGSGIRLGKRYFWGMFVLGLASTLIGQQLASILGPILALLIGWIIVVFVSSWYKMTVLLVYKRRRETLVG